MVLHGFIKLNRGAEYVGTLRLVLYDDSVPRTVSNFVAFLEGRVGSGVGGTRGYKGSAFHRLIRGFMIQGGDIVNGDGTGSCCIYSGRNFNDENFIHSHNRIGVLSMANSGRNTNGCQFFITFRATSHLDNKHVVFGHVDLKYTSSNDDTSSKNGLEILRTLEQTATGANDKPLVPITVADCGLIHQQEQKQQVVVDEQIVQNKDNDEFEIDVDEVDEEEEEPQDENDASLSKADKIRLRMRKLKMKMNQARNLNRQAVRKEGEQIANETSVLKTNKKQQQVKEEQKTKQQLWAKNNAHALKVAESLGIDSTKLVESAASNIKSYDKQQEKNEINRFDINDYYNPEGQHRNYLRNVKSIPQQQQSLPSSNNNSNDGNLMMYNPVGAGQGISEQQEQKERRGASKLAKEMHRRIEKSNKRKLENKSKLEFEQTDVTYVNQRNKRFNQKINRNYDQHTAEIRQNLERGTAL